MYHDYFHSRGIECVIADPREAEYRNGRLSFGDGDPVDLIYKRVLIHELVEQCGIDSPMVRAVRDRAVCMVERLPLQDAAQEGEPRGAERRAERAPVRRRRARGDRRARPVDADGRRAERRSSRAATSTSSPFMREHREQLVLKPNDDYGGAGITLGWTVDDAAWARGHCARARRAAHRAGARAHPVRAVPEPGGRHVQVVDRMLDTAPFVSYGEYMEGYLTRLSTAALLNVTAGGGSTVPTFLVESGNRMADARCRTISICATGRSYTFRRDQL